MTNFVGKINCKLCGAYFEAFEVTKKTGLIDIKCPRCKRKGGLYVLEFKRKVRGSGKAKV